MKEKYINYTEKKIKNHFFEIKVKEDLLIFNLKNAVPFTKNFLIVKNRKTGKRIRKPLKKNKASISIKEIIDIGEYGNYDIYTETHVFKKIFLKRIRFVMHNSSKLLFDKKYKKQFESFSTNFYNLSFRFRDALFIAKAVEIKKVNNEILLNGEVELFSKVNFDTIEILLKLSSERYIFPCAWECEDELIKFNSKIKFNVNSEDLDEEYELIIRLKNNGVIVAENNIKVDNLCEISDKFIECIDNDESGNNISSLCIANKRFNLAFHVILKNNIGKFKDNHDKFYKILPEIDDKKIIFLESFHGKSYSGQPKYIYEKLVELGYENQFYFIWSYEGNLKIPGNPLVINRQYSQYKKLLKKSDYWINNLSFPIYKHNKNIIYLQTSHGTPYKIMGADIKTYFKNVNVGKVLKDSKTWDYLLSSNEYSKKIFKRAFKYNGEIIHKGFPANDVFYRDNTDRINRIKENITIPNDKKIILYAPTYRDYEIYDENSKSNQLLNFKKLHDELSQDHIIITRFHYLISQNLFLSDELKDFVFDLSDYDDITDLYLISDILITDYSSSFFDFAHSKKPVLFYVPDYDEYCIIRGLYEEIRDKLPGPELYSSEELIYSLKNIEKVKDEYEMKYESFYNEFCSSGHGTAAEDVIYTIFGENLNEH